MNEDDNNNCDCDDDKGGDNDDGGDGNYGKADISIQVLEQHATYLSTYESLPKGDGRGRRSDGAGGRNCQSSSGGEGKNLAEEPLQTVGAAAGVAAVGARLLLAVTEVCCWRS